MKDPRFNKDAHQVARLKAVRYAKYGRRPAVRHGAYQSASSQSMSNQSMSSQSTGEVTPSKVLEAGKWPVQLPRHYKPASAQSIQGPRQDKAEKIEPLVDEPDTSCKPTNNQPLPSWARDLEQALLCKETSLGHPVDKKQAFDEDVDSKSASIDEQFKSACEATRRVSNSGVAGGAGSVQSNDTVRGGTVASDSELYETNKVGSVSTTPSL
jgi:hypothetical protein